MVKPIEKSGGSKNNCRPISFNRTKSILAPPKILPLGKTK